MPINVVINDVYFLTKFQEFSPSFFSSRKIKKCSRGAENVFISKGFEIIHEIQGSLKLDSTYIVEEQ